MSRLHLVDEAGNRIPVEGMAAEIATLLAVHQAEVNRYTIGSVEFCFNPGDLVLKLHPSVAAIKRRKV